MDCRQANVVYDWDCVCEEHLIHYGHEVKVCEIGGNPNFPIHKHRVHKFVLDVFDTLHRAFTFNAIDQYEKSGCADRSETQLVNH